MQADLGVTLPLDSLLQEATIDRMVRQLMSQLTMSTSFSPVPGRLTEVDAADDWEVLEL
jgi:hypothetical protein